MIGKKSGFLGLFNQNYPGNNVVFLHCVIHQDALCKSALNMKPMLDAVVKLVNTIRSRGHTHRQFRDFLQSVQSEYSDVLYYTKVRWLSAGCVFERVGQLKDDIVSFFHDKQCSAECEMLEDTERLSDFAFFTDLLCHMNNLNGKMQGKNQFIDDIWAHLKAFKHKLNLLAGQLANNDLSHFSRLNSIPSVNEEKLKNYEDGLKKLHFEFERRFQDFSAIQTKLDIFTMPFNLNCEAVRSDLQLELIELQSNNHLKQSFLNMPKLEFYKSLSKAQPFRARNDVLLVCLWSACTLPFFCHTALMAGHSQPDFCDALYSNERTALWTSWLTMLFAAARPVFHAQVEDDLGEGTVTFINVLCRVNDSSHDRNLPGSSTR
ncbi:General transcription factor II-I repeat domain-containing protein 2 [Araneus ventricosus]|uniref:General transcription factor II-I repeat domain-containing protein 2 n=1 Tax=Araneus ventricosus TaxID=182803 RepID=A0A4Y2N7K8_ARAVE|nr:General transcription factor II-I repeat domain-containing protein 2 [Araneus ventricosus]